MLIWKCEANKCLLLALFPIHIKQDKYVLYNITIYNIIF